jgi:hypothetical protein
VAAVGVPAVVVPVTFLLVEDVVAAVVEQDSHLVVHSEELLDSLVLLFGELLGEEIAVVFHELIRVRLRAVHLEEPAVVHERAMLEQERVAVVRRDRTARAHPEVEQHVLVLAVGFFVLPVLQKEAVHGEESFLHDHLAVTQEGPATAVRIVGEAVADLFIRHDASRFLNYSNAHRRTPLPDAEEAEVRAATLVVAAAPITRMVQAEQLLYKEHNFIR